jgi:AraC-like DNA-binding protein
VLNCRIAVSGEAPLAASGNPAPTWGRRLAATSTRPPAQRTAPRLLAAPQKDCPPPPLATAPPAAAPRANLSIEAIASRTGYANDASLSKAFKREFGVSPGTYRRLKGDVGALEVR